MPAPTEPAVTAKEPPQATAPAPAEPTVTAKEPPPERELPPPKTGFKGTIPFYEVEAYGYGSDINEAEKNALNEAVRKAVGFYLVSQRITVNDKAQTKICTNADAAILDSKRLEKCTLGDKSIRILMKVWIVKKQFEAIIAKNVTDSIDSKMIRNIESEYDRFKDTYETLRILLDGFPDSVIRTQLIGGLRVSDDAQIRNDGKIDITYQLKITVHLAKYYEFINKLEGVLKKVSISSERIYCLNQNDLPLRQKEMTRCVLIGRFLNYNRQLNAPGTVVYTKYELPERLFKPIRESLYSQSNSLYVKFFNRANELVYSEGVYCDTPKLTYYRPNEAKLFYFDKKNNYRICERYLNVLCISPFVSNTDYAIVTVKTAMSEDTRRSLVSCSPHASLSKPKAERVEFRHGKTELKRYYTPFIGINCAAEGGKYYSYRTKDGVQKKYLDKGFVIGDVEPYSPAGKSGLKAGDILYGLGTEKGCYLISDFEDFRKWFVSVYYPNDFVTLYFIRNGGRYRINMQVGQYP